jgi:hypothetical protein
VSGGATGALTSALVHELLAQSLIAWRIGGHAVRDADGAVVISGLAGDIRVERAPQGAPFRWTVTAAGRRRAAVSLVAVLRQVRGALDPGYVANRVRIAVSPLVPE